MATAPVPGAGLRGLLDATLATLAPRLREGPGTGDAACREIAAVYDRALATAYAAARAQAAAGLSSRLALVATGGWARRELAPYSDIDFILLHDGDERAAKQLSDRLLYPLWDEKLAIGHAVREPRAVARLAKDDLATATALLDARHIAGDRRLTTELLRGTLAALAPGSNPNELIGALADEKKHRHERFGASLYLLEPNLKQGIGALRDLSTALWAAAIRWHPPRTEAIEDPAGAPALIDALVAMGHLTRRQAQVLAGARDFLLRIRALVQLTAKRRFDQLTFEIQEAIAPGLYPRAVPHEGDIRSAVAPAVEALMSDYYLHARGVVQVADRLLESARVPARRRPRIHEVDHCFITFNGELALRDPKLFVERPSEMVRLFRVAVAGGLPVYGHTRELAAETIARDPKPLGTDPLAQRLLLEALLDLRDAGQPSALEVMQQLGILAVLMPEWAPCTGRVQHDLYHVYTVDQHQLYAVAMQKRLARGELADLHPTATELWREVTRPAPLILGTLLHDVGKPLGKGHAEKGAVIAGVIGRRLGMSDADVELTEFLVRQHLTMSHLSQRRDLSDPEVIARFAERVGSDERLVQLYLLSLCDAAMTNPDNLTAWKADLLRDLMLRARAHFRGGGQLGQAAPQPDLRAKVVQLAGGDEDPAIARIIDGIDPRLFTQLTPRQAARHARLVAAACAAAPQVAIEVHCWPLKGHSEVAIVAPDAPGVLAAIAGALTASRLDVLGAVLGHVDLAAGAPAASGDTLAASGDTRAASGDTRAADGAARRLVTDVFYVRDLKGAAISEDDARWQRLLGDLRALLDGPPDPAEVATLIARRRPRSGMPKRVTPGVVTEIRIHDDSAQATIIEIATRDRVGVLYAITHTLAELGLDISLAKVSTEGERVSDAFFVTRGGRRITDPTERAQIVGRLSAAVDEPGLTDS
ncbi:MAG TPA: [protein-PII] uridylyltransferase [Kofleriaceae bacterium]|nr:[protein-PII] uridylyltransferase [Kofleriaceae bacterium]